MKQARRDWAWAALGAVVAVCVTTAAGLVTWTSAGSEHSRLEEDRAIALARSIAYVAGHRPAGEVDRAIDELAQELDGRLREAYFLGTGEVDRFGLSLGNVYLANLDPDLVNTDPRRSSDPRQKTLFDRTEEVLGSAGPYLERLREAPRDGLDGAAPYFELQDEQGDGGQDFTNVTVPVVGRDGTLVGVAGVSVEPLGPSPAVPWLSIVLLGLAAGVALFVVGMHHPRSDRASRLRAGLMGGLMVALMLVAGLWLSSWEAGAYRDAMERYAAEANAWLATTVEHTDAGAVDYALRNYRDARAVDLTALPFSAQAATRDRSAPTAFALTFLLLGAVLVGLHGFLVRTFRHVAKSPWAYVYVLPSMVGMLVLVFGPFLFGVALSFHERDAGRFVPAGISHYVSILSGERSSEVTFYWTLFVTLLWTFTNVIIHVVVGLSLALILNDTLLRFKKFYRVALILPWAIPNYITALIWRGMFDTNDGAVNRILATVGIEPVDWLGGSFTSAFMANLVTNSWLGFPFMMVVSLGALQSIPAELYEAADVDGATRWQKFRTITLPLLKPALFPAIILGSIWTFNMFNIIYLVSGGGPNHSTEILITEAYKAFYVLGRWGYAAAYSVIIFVILLLFSSILNRVSRATEGAFD